MATAVFGESSLVTAKEPIFTGSQTDLNLRLTQIGTGDFGQHFWINEQRDTSADATGFDSKHMHVRWRLLKWRRRDYGDRRIVNPQTARYHAQGDGRQSCN